MAALDVHHPSFTDQSSFEQLVLITQALRGPGGCPWDIAQTHQTLKRYLVEESYEALQAIEEQDFPKMCEELGDLLLQIVLHAQLARESGRFQIEDVCRSIVDKMIRRHPHVFGDGAELHDPEQVLTQWAKIKREEGASSALEGLPAALPSIVMAEQMQKRAAKAGFTWRNAEGAWSKFLEEVEEFRQHPSEDELGDILFACVSLARFHDLDPDAALRSTCRKYRQRFGALEQQFGPDMTSHSLEELTAAWNAAKKF